MPRLMSFALTIRQFKDGTKDVTRRLGWRNAQPGDIVEGCEKGMGLKRGEKVVRLGLIRFTDVRLEPLEAITAHDVIREGFPEMSRQEFIHMFCTHNKCEPDREIARIVFEHIDGL